MPKIKALIREKKEDNTTLRKSGFVPAVFYGPKQETVTAKVKESDFIKLYSEAGTSSIISLDDGQEEHEALVHDVQFDAVSHKPIHVDFYVIEKGKKIEVEVPIIFEGIAPAEKNLGGVLVKVMHTLKIQALPKDLPRDVTVDVSSLVDFEKQILAKDIKLGQGVELLVDPEDVVVLVQEHKEEVEEAPIDLDSIEVEKKGKTEEDAGNSPQAEEKSE